MCRLMAIPPAMSRNDALDIILDMESKNTDGFGFAFTSKGKIHSFKTADSVSDCIKKIKKSDNILRYFPTERNGWLILHIRNATHGAVSSRNAHPFVLGDIAMVHNGTLKNHELISAAMGKIKLTSQTDSEIGLHFFVRTGYRKFTRLIDNSGVFLFLRSDGTLCAIKTHVGGDLAIAKLDKHNFFLVSELKKDEQYESDELPDGYFIFDTNSKFVHGQEKGRKEKFDLKSLNFRKYSGYPFVQTSPTNHREYDSPFKHLITKSIKTIDMNDPRTVESELSHSHCWE